MTVLLDCKEASPESGMACLWDSSKLLQPAHFYQDPPLDEAILTEDVPQARHLAAVAPAACNCTVYLSFKAACCALLDHQVGITKDSVETSSFTGGCRWREFSLCSPI